MADIKLHGFWYSPFTLRVVWTLNLKGIPYENIEEDRFNKSPQLLEYNPIHKKTPVLVHDGKPICESMIIVEYIDEIWPQSSLLPVDPYDRAQARFWVKYVDELILAIRVHFRSKSGEEREKARENIWERLGVVEDQCLDDQKKFYGGDTINIVDIALGSFVNFIKFSGIAAHFRSKSGEEREKAKENIWERLIVIEDQCLGDQKKFYGGDTINIVDIALASFVNFIAVQEDMFEVKILQTEKFPRLHLWFNNFKNVPVIKENTPGQEKLVAFLKGLREKMFALASS
ncbi:glutathione S-transferase-like protein [Trifolium pratense]|uniref:glutathione transferase n=1 Tax=Trifolium pratense TaxID=57577 RepID=A0A2K3NQX4_TRIPR|nr:glutathione S-transferase-like protein [Trifolium pratense]